MSWNNRSYFSGQSSNSQYSSSTDVYGGGQHQATGGKKRSSSRLKKSSSKTADEDYPRYTTHDGDNGNYNDNYNSYSSGGYNGYGSITPYYGGGGGGGGYNNSNSSYGNGGDNGYGRITPYYGGGGGGYNNSNSSYSNGGGYNKRYSSYSNSGDGYTGGAPIPYNSPVSSWAAQDGTRSPMFISTRELNVYGATPGPQYDNGYRNEQRQRGGGGFFRPVFEAIGHFVDGKFGFNDRD